MVFALAGVAFASFASRIADSKAALGLSAGELGLTLFAASVGSVLTPARSPGGSPTGSGRPGPSVWAWWSASIGLVVIAVAVDVVEVAAR